MKKRPLAAAVLAVLLSVTLSGTTFSVDDDLPSLFHNDEAWYKDGAAPLVLRDNVYYVPAELFSMFEEVRVETPNDNNLLIWNTETESYVSILFEEQRAAVNGTIIEDINVFRDGGVTYVDAKQVAATVGITTEIITQEDSGVSMRLSDENKILTTEELIRPYLPEEAVDEFAGLGEEEYLDLKRIFVICHEPSPDAEVSALAILQEYDMGYTLFLEGDTSTDALLAASAGGEYGIFVPENTAAEEVVASLNGINASFYRFTQYQTHFTMTTGDYTTDDLLRSAAYCPVSPNFTVTSAVDPDVMFADMLQYLGSNDYCVLLLEDCTQSKRMIELMNKIDRERFLTSNLGN